MIIQKPLLKKGLFFSFFLQTSVLSLPTPLFYFRKVQGDFISLKDVLAWMDSGEPFSITFITCNKRNGTGGERITIEKAYTRKWLSPEERKKQQHLQPASNIIKKHPKHYENSTRNILLAANGDIRKVHIRLIRKFNGRTVL